MRSYPNEPIGGGNPYWCCKSCKRSDPEINGRLEKHHSWCEWRLAQEQGNSQAELWVRLKARVKHLPSCCLGFDAGFSADDECDCGQSDLVEKFETTFIRKPR